MKKYNIFFLIITIFFILSCKQSFLEVEKKNYKVEGVYSLVSEDIKQTSIKIMYAPIDSLNHFKDIGISFPTNYGIMTYNSKFNLLIISTQGMLYFIDSKTHKIIKQQSFDEFYKSSFANANQLTNGEENISNMNLENNSLFGSYRKFIVYNEDYCFLLQGLKIYKINFKDMTKEIIVDFNADAIKADVTYDEKYIYILSYSGGYERTIHHLYKYDLINSNLEKIYTIDQKEYKYRNLVISKDYVSIIANQSDIHKFDLRDNKLIEIKNFNLLGYNLGFDRYIGTGKNNKIYCLSSDKKLYTLDLDNYELKDYLDGMTLRWGDFKFYYDGLYYLGKDYNSHKIINLDTKEIKYSFLNDYLNQEFELKINNK